MPQPSPGADRKDNDMPRPDPFSTYVSSKLAGQDPATPPDTASQRSDLTFKDKVAAKLAGQPAPEGQPPAPQGVDQDVWTAAWKSAHTPGSADFDLANALLVVGMMA
jgi:hypothetical protein